MLVGSPGRQSHRTEVRKLDSSTNWTQIGGSVIIWRRVDTAARYALSRMAVCLSYVVLKVVNSDAPETASTYLQPP